MDVHAAKAGLKTILPLRASFLAEASHQVRYNARHERGWSDSYVLTLDGLVVGYGAVMGQEIADRDTVFEFFVLSEFRYAASPLFRALLAASGARFIECQSNDVLLAPRMFEFGHDISAYAFLFEAGTTGELIIPGAIFRRRRDNEPMFTHTSEPVGRYAVEMDGAVVATGDFLTHYNPPFADIHMEVAPSHRRRGIGSFLVQEVIRECFAAGLVPAARCDLANAGSRATLIRAGLRECGFMLFGTVRSH